MSAVPFEALEQLQIVRDFLDAFQKATGVRLKLVACSARSAGLASDFSPKAFGDKSDATTSLQSLAIPLLIGGENVATFQSELLRVTTPRLSACDRLLRIFVKLLADFASRHLIANGRHDPPAVARAKQFIHDRVTDRLTLGAVACHAGLSVDHFRKVFRKAAGMPFTDYVARTRLEKAKEIIADPTTRIGDAAFAAGFQSLPYFSRVFKKHTGMSPKQFRASLRISQSSSSSSSSSSSVRSVPKTFGVTPLSRQKAPRARMK